MANISPITNTSKEAICDLTASQVRSLFYYCPDSGKMIRRVRSGPTGRPGDVAGSLRKSGYRSIQVLGRLYVEHRVIWLWWYGVWPSLQIDHINGVRDDNRIENLRLASNAENQQNAGARKDNKLGVKGVYRVGRRYRVLIGAGGSQRHVGYFRTIEAAKEAYASASATLHGEFSRTS